MGVRGGEKGDDMGWRKGGRGGDKLLLPTAGTVRKELWFLAEQNHRASSSSPLPVQSRSKVPSPLPSFFKP